MESVEAGDTLYVLGKELGDFGGSELFQFDEVN